MTIQPLFRFGRDRASVEDADQHPDEETASDGGDKNPYTTTETPNASSFNSDEKQTYGVSKVEAVTSVWTKAALVTLYVLYLPFVHRF
jgi:hypothetical protein